jgi:RND family efflux transporter MFP subunit
MHRVEPVVSVASVASLLLAAVLGCEGGSSRESKDDEDAAGGAPLTVRAEPARRRTIDEFVHGLGRCEPLPEKLAAIIAGVEGRVLKILSAPGDAVKAGQPIVELDPTIALANLDEKTASRQTLEASLRLLRALPRPEERKSLELAIEQAKAGVEKADSTVQRLRPLIERREISAEQMHQAEVALWQARLQQQTAQLQLDIAMLGPRSQAVDEAQAKIAAAGATVAAAKAQLELCTIRAPISGVLDSLACHPGQAVAIGAPIGEIVDVHQVFVVVGLSVADARHVQPGQSARIAPPASGEAVAGAPRPEMLLGRVTTAGRIADPQTGNLPVRILVDNARGNLVTGQIAVATIVFRENRDRLAVPAEAIQDLGEGPVLVVVREGKAAVLHPKSGVRDARWVEVLDTDLQAGELVVTDGAYNLPEGTPLNVEKAAETAPHESKTDPPSPPAAAAPPDRSPGATP